MTYVDVNYLRSDVEKTEFIFICKHFDLDPLSTNFKYGLKCKNCKMYAVKCYSCNRKALAKTTIKTYRNVNEDVHDKWKWITYKHFTPKRKMNVSKM